MIINSILDNDLYKLSMQQAVCQLYPRALVRYKFTNRGGTKFPEGFAEKLKLEIEWMELLRLDRIEKYWLSQICYFLTPVYIDFLSGYTYNPHEVSVVQSGGDIDITIEGPWYSAIMWEVPLMAMISELYFKMSNLLHYDNEVLNITDKKKADAFEFIIGAKIAEFGTRRRFSQHNQVRVLDNLKRYAPTSLVGTSNVHLAHSLGLKPIGTQAHEWFMFHAAKYGFRMANSMALGRWVDVYHGDLGIALSDTFTSNAFFESFDTMYGKLFDGVRQDSGDPFEFAEKLIKHYEKIRVDATTKTVVFSDGIDSIDLVGKLVNFCKNRIRCSFGIGTWLTNDVGVKPLNMVIKMSECKPEGTGSWIPVIKLSDNKGKNTGNKEMIEICKKTFGIGEQK